MLTSFVLLSAHSSFSLSLSVCSSCRSAFNLFSENSWNDFSFCVSGGAASTRCWTCSPPSRKATSEESKFMWTGFRFGEIVYFFAFTPADGHYWSSHIQLSSQQLLHPSPLSSTWKGLYDVRWYGKVFVLFLIPFFFMFVTLKCWNLQPNLNIRHI